MKGFLRALAASAAAAGEKTVPRRFIYICCLLGLVLVEFILFGKARRSFVFYTTRENEPVVESRMLARSGSRELGIRRYVEEAVLGPVSLDLSPLLTAETVLDSFLFRDGVVYANFSALAALPPLAEKADLYHNLLTLKEGILRNFPFVRDVRFFIAGNEAFSDKFRSFGPEE
ncbi:MAG: hypothetical protein LBK64_05960 [Spirochaetaceae bacterium]|jgi:hypothetical protein|nr:hypothetical protein [Spirochaetaceae bacterium]